MVAARAAADGLGSLAYLACLFHVPLGNTTAIGQAVPLFVTVGAVLVLHERVPIRRWAAIIAGFSGVLLVVQPGASGFNAFAWFGVLATLLNAARDLMTRFVPAHVPTILVTASAAILVTLFGGVLALVQGFQPMTGQQWLLLFAAAVLLATGYQLLIVSMRAGDMSVIAPFRYSGLLFALIVGHMVWGDVPNALAWCGIALLVGAGLYMLLGDRLRRKMASAN
jgi:drug/metabolite transporter (DMT)-like permease